MKNTLNHESGFIKIDPSVDDPRFPGFLQGFNRRWFAENCKSVYLCFTPAGTAAALDGGGTAHEIRPNLFDFWQSHHLLQLKVLKNYYSEDLCRAGSGAARRSGCCGMQQPEHEHSRCHLPRTAFAAWRLQSFPGN